jgi:hypothetical protein
MNTQRGTELPIFLYLLLLPYLYLFPRLHSKVCIKNVLLNQTIFDETNS